MLLHHSAEQGTVWAVLLRPGDGLHDRSRCLGTASAHHWVGTLEKIRARKDPEHKPISQWIVCRHQEAIELMVAVYPFMGTRRQAKIRELLAQFEKRPA